MRLMSLPRNLRTFFHSSLTAFFSFIRQFFDLKFKEHLEREVDLRPTWFSFPTSFTSRWPCRDEVTNLRVANQSVGELLEGMSDSGNHEEDSQEHEEDSA
jgi:hypothetical protein